MLRAMSSHVRVRERLQVSHLEAMVRGGAQAIELFCQKEHFDYTDRGRTREFASWFREHPGMLHSMHSPMYSEPDFGRHMAPPVNLVDNEKRQRVEAMDEIKRAIEFAEQRKRGHDACGRRPFRFAGMRVVFLWMFEGKLLCFYLSYARLLPSAWAGASPYVAWNITNWTLAS